jgi:hypothetical protein
MFVGVPIGGVAACSGRQALTGVRGNEAGDGAELTRDGCCAVSAYPGE